jgi:hypothetical protein
MFPLRYVTRDSIMVEALLPYCHVGIKTTIDQTLNSACIHMPKSYQICLSFNSNTDCIITMHASVPRNISPLSQNHNLHTHHFQRIKASSRR